MPSGPKKRKAARRKNEAAKSQNQQQEHIQHPVITLDKDTEKDESFGGSLEDQDEGFSSPSPSPSPNLPPQQQNSTFSSSEPKDERLCNTEEWVRVSSFGAGLSPGKIERQKVASEDANIISPSTPGPSDRLADWETISNSSFPEDNQCSQTSEGESNPKLSIGSTDQAVIDTYFSNSKFSDDNMKEPQSDSGINVRSGSKDTEQSAMGKSFSEPVSKDILESASACEYDFDSDHKTETTPCADVEESKPNHRSDSLRVSESIVKPDSGEFCSDSCDSDKEQTVVTSLQGQRRAIDPDSMSPNLMGKEIAFTSLDEKDAKQDAHEPEAVEDKENKLETVASTPADKTAKNCMMAVDKQSREDTGQPSSTEIMDKEASCDDAYQKSFEKNSSEISDAMKADAKISLTGPGSTDSMAAEKEEISKSEGRGEALSNEFQSCETIGLPARKDDNGFIKSERNIDSAINAADANELKANSSQIFEQHKAADFVPLLSKELKTGEHHSEDTTQKMPDSYENQVQRGLNDRKIHTSWKECCGVFDWLSGSSR